MSKNTDELTALRAELDALKTRVAAIEYREQMCPGVQAHNVENEMAAIRARNAQRDASIAAAAPVTPEPPPRAYVRIEVSPTWGSPMVLTPTVTAYDEKLHQSRQVMPSWELAKGGHTIMLASDLEDRAKVDEPFGDYVRRGVLTIATLPEEECREIERSARRASEMQKLMRKLSM